MGGWVPAGGLGWPLFPVTPGQGGMRGPRPPGPRHEMLSHHHPPARPPGSPSRLPSSPSPSKAALRSQLAPRLQHTQHRLGREVLAECLLG